MKTFSALMIVLGLIVIVVKLMTDLGDFAGWIFIISVMATIGWLLGRKQASQSPSQPQETALVAKEGQSKMTVAQVNAGSQRLADEPRYGQIKNK